ncbi:MAG: hypothetical protein RIR39_1556 [Pseudomonadota bacterium]|jgi:hypothetical protein
MASKVAGICYIKVDGSQLEVSGNIEIPIAQTSKKAVMSLTGVAGYEEKVQRQFVKLDAIFRSDFPLKTITQGTNMTITTELANGQVYTLAGAFMEGDDVSAKPDTGEVSIEFTGTTGFFQ